MWPPYRHFLIIVLLFLCVKAYGQQDVEFHLNDHFLAGKTILKVKRDFYDPYLWVLASNNGVYRINSLTKVVDDYTPKFSAYNTFQFVDIAGRSQDTVFIATNSSNVIQYINGAERLIGASDGILGIVNSVGMQGNTIITNQTSATKLMIATDNGFYLYDTDTQQIINSAPTNVGISKIYEATYRTVMYKDTNAANSNFITGDTVQYQPVVVQSGITTYVEFLWENGNEFGYNITTADNITDAIYGNQVFASLFWGGNKGMSQNVSNFSYNPLYFDHGHYLNNIKVNKITDIYGLVAYGGPGEFDFPGLIRQNLLVGTVQGLYFSSSLYQNYASSSIHAFSLFHDDELGNIPINDICVNPVATKLPLCEDGVWVACNDGLYLLKPDYAKYVAGPQFQAANFQDQPGVSDAKICADGSITATIDAGKYTGNTIQWYKNGQELPDQSQQTLQITTAGEYYAVLYDPCEVVHLETNHLTVEVINAPVFTFNYPDKMQYCSGTPVTLQTAANSLYQYRWYTNSVLNGVTTNAFEPTQTGKYKVEVSACPGSWVASKEVEVDFISLPTPTITSDKQSYCIGDQATLAVAVPADPSYTINWYRDNVLLTANTNQLSLTTTTAGNYTVAVVNNAANTDGSICSQSSVVFPLTFNPPPTVNIAQVITTTLCEGQTIALKANYSGGTVLWSTGETTDQINVSTTGNYKVTVTSPSGCVSNANTSVVFFPNPTFSVSDATICTYSHQAVTLTAPAGFANYAWNGQPGEQTYQVTQAQTVTLMVTDVNGCQATRDIQVTDQCPIITIPNTFTPNGDGINDTWKIAGLENDPTVTVRVFSRYGSQVYESRGYGIAWNGEYHGKKLPAGTYYYIITAENENQKFSGSLTIIY